MITKNKRIKHDCKTTIVVVNVILGQKNEFIYLRVQTTLNTRKCKCGYGAAYVQRVGRNLPIIAILRAFVVDILLCVHNMTAHIDI